MTKEYGWGDIASEGAKEAGETINRSAVLAQNKEQLKLAKKKRLAEMLARGLKRDTNLYRLQNEIGDENTENQVSAIQDVARGFAESYRR